MDTVHIVVDHVFHTPLDFWEAVAHSNIPLIFRIISRPFACLPEPLSSFVMWSLPSLSSQNLPLSLLLLQPIHTGLLAFLMPNSFLLFEHLMFPVPGMLFPPHLPFSQMTHWFPSDLPPPKGLSWLLHPLPADLPLTNSLLSTYSALVFIALSLELYNLFTCLL